MKVWLRTWVVALTVISTGCAAVGMPAAQASVATGVPEPTPQPIRNGDLSGYNADGSPKDEQVRSAPAGALVLTPSQERTSTPTPDTAEENNDDGFLLTMLLVGVLGGVSLGVLAATGAFD